MVQGFGLGFGVEGFGVKDGCKLGNFRSCLSRSCVFKVQDLGLGFNMLVNGL